jgi:hypothetical protein
MSWKSLVLAAAVAAFAVVTGPQHPLSLGVAWAGCEAGERVDSSTAADATRKLQAQGYRNARDLKKGCDNFWYGYATKDGQEQHVSVSPSGEILQQHE